MCCLICGLIYWWWIANLLKAQIQTNVLRTWEQFRLNYYSRFLWTCVRLTWGVEETPRRLPSYCWPSFKINILTSREEDPSYFVILRFTIFLCIIFRYPVRKGNGHWFCLHEVNIHIFHLIKTSSFLPLFSTKLTWKTFHIIKKVSLEMNVEIRMDVPGK